MKRVVAVLLLGCFFSTNFAAMPPKEDRAFQLSLSRGYQLAKYDYYSGLGFEEISKRGFSSDTTKISFYVFSIINGMPSVFWGKLNTSQNYEISYSFQEVNNVFDFKDYSTPILIPEVTTAAVCLSNFIDKSVSLSDNPMQNYSFLVEKDTVFCYMWPASPNPNTIIFGGGYRGAYLKKTCEFLRLDSLHFSSIPFEYPQPPNPRGENGIPMRGAVKQTVLSEIDVAQSLIYKRQFTEQFIATKKYVFIFKYNVQTGKDRFDYIVRSSEP